MRASFEFTPPREKRYSSMSPSPSIAQNVTPLSSRRYSSPLPPSGSRTTPIYSDRFIPSRRSSNLEEVFDVMDGNDASATRNDDNMQDGGSSTQSGDRSTENQEQFNSLLRSELLGHVSPGYVMENDTSSYNSNAKAPKMNLFKYTFSSSPSTTARNSLDRLSGLFDSTGISPTSTSSPAKLTTSSPDLTKKYIRKISKLPYKVLDAPSLCDDFYLNLIDWSSSNVLAVALGTSVYLWSACTSKATQVCDLAPVSVTSITWSDKGDYLAVGNNSGKVQIWDVAAQKKVREMQSHISRVGVMNWSSSLLATGSRDRHIYVHDLRIRSFYDTNNTVASATESTDNPSSRLSSSTSASLFDSPSVFPPMAPFSSSISAATSSPSVAPWIPNAPVSGIAQSNGVLNQSPGPRGSTVEEGVFTPIRESIIPTMTLASTGVSDTPSRDPCIIYDFNYHKQEVCGLKWSFDDKYLASGGNDNKLFVWSIAHGHNNITTAGSMSRQFNISNSNLSSMSNTMNTMSTMDGSSSTPLTGSSPSRVHSSSALAGTNGGVSGNSPGPSNGNIQRSDSAGSSSSCAPLHEFSDHLAAVKAVAWSPHQHGLLASGGGTADRHIRFWNAVTGSPLHKIDTGSQVCNLLWSKSVNELVSTHGYSLNQVIIWKYPSMQKLATLTGHTLRVLYLAGSPDGQSIVTGAGDETIRFWNVFPGSKHRSTNKLGPSVLIPSALEMR